MNKLTITLLFAAVVGACIAQGESDGAVDGEIEAQGDRRMRCRCGEGPLHRMFKGEKPIGDGESGEGRGEGDRRGPPRGDRDGQGEGGRRGPPRGEGGEGERRGPLNGDGQGEGRGPRGDREDEHRPRGEGRRQQGEREGQGQGEGGRRRPQRGEGQVDGERAGPTTEDGHGRPKCQCRPRGERNETEEST